MVIKLNVELELFSYDELSEKAKENAYNDHEEFIFSVGVDYENEKGDIVNNDLSEWNTSDVIQYVEDSIRANEYLFFASGELANVTHYTGLHHKAPRTELEFMGKVYEVNF